MLEYVLLGVLQGVTEWLPISSKSQVILTAVNFLGVTGLDALKLSLFLHVGTLLAAVAYFRTTVWNLVLEIPKLPHASKTFHFLFWATLSTGVLGIPLYLAFRGSFDLDNARLLTGWVGVGLLATAALLHVKPRGTKTENQAGWTDAVFAGLLQAFSVLPGVSRSGTTTAALLWRGIRQEDALRLSFLMSILAVAAAEVVFSVIEDVPNVALVPATVMIGSAFVTGYLTIEALMRVARHVSFSWFCAGLGVIALVGALL